VVGGCRGGHCDAFWRLTKATTGGDTLTEERMAFLEALRRADEAENHFAREGIRQWVRAYWRALIMLVLMASTLVCAWDWRWVDNRA